MKLKMQSLRRWKLSKIICGGLVASLASIPISTYAKPNRGAGKVATDPNDKCEFFDRGEGKTLANNVTSNVNHFWCRMKSDARVQTDIESLLSFEGIVMGDPHFRNFSDYQNGGESGIHLYDSDDAGHAPLILDFVRYMVFVEAYERSEEQIPNGSIKFGDVFQSYRDGLAAGAKLQTQPSAEEIRQAALGDSKVKDKKLIEYMTDLGQKDEASTLVEHFCWAGPGPECNQENVKALDTEGHFLAKFSEKEQLNPKGTISVENLKKPKPGEKETLDLALKKADEIFKLLDNPSVLQTALDGYTLGAADSWKVADQAWSVKASGSSRGQVRIWLALKSRHGDYSVVEFKQMGDPGVAQYQPIQPDLESRLQEAREAYADVTLGTESKIVSIGDAQFWRRPRHFFNYDFDLLAEKTAKKPNNAAVDLVFFLAHWMGLHQGLQENGKALAAAFNSKSEDQIEAVVRNYLAEIQIGSGSRNMKD